MRLSGLGLGHRVLRLWCRRRGRTFGMVSCLGLIGLIFVLLFRLRRTSWSRRCVLGLLRVLVLVVIM